METGSLSTLFMRETERHSLLKIFGSRAEVLYAIFLFAATLFCALTSDSLIAMIPFFAIKSMLRLF